MIDTNVFASAALYPASVPGQTVAAVMASGRLLISVDAWDELVDVLQRRHFHVRLPEALRTELLAGIEAASDFISISTHVQACRDPKDNKFLELALDGHADILITGDLDLLALHPFRGIDILSPAQFLERFSR